jgi:hypothetical protein
MRKQAWYAFLMGTHPRVGSGSKVFGLHQQVLRNIFEHVRSPAGLALEITKHSVHRVRGPNDYVVSNLRKFAIETVVFHRKSRRPAEHGLWLRATVFCEDGTAVSPCSTCQTGCENCMLLGDVEAPLIDGVALFREVKMGKLLLSARHAGHRFRLKIEPKDAAVRAAYPWFVVLSEPFRVVTKLPPPPPMDATQPPLAGLPQRPLPPTLMPPIAPPSAARMPIAPPSASVAANVASGPGATGKLQPGCALMSPPLPCLPSSVASTPAVASTPSVGSSLIGAVASTPSSTSVPSAVLGTGLPPSTSMPQAPHIHIHTSAQMPQAPIATPPLQQLAPVTAPAQPQPRVASQPAPVMAPVTAPVMAPITAPDMAPVTAPAQPQPRVSSQPAQPGPLRAPPPAQLELPKMVHSFRLGGVGAQSVLMQQPPPRQPGLVLAPPLEPSSQVGLTGQPRGTGSIETAPRL